MGHMVNSEREYRLLQQRLDHNITGAPYSPVFISILKLLFTPEEANIARQIPLRPTPLPVVARKLGLEPDRLYSKILPLAERGLVFDFQHRGQTYIVLAPVVIGFFEFIFMRARDNLPLDKLAQLFEEYMSQDDRFARSVFTGSTQLGRALVHEQALPADSCAEILDWERATAIVAAAQTIGVSLCTCRHKAMHLNRNCQAPLETCLTMGRSAALLIQKGLAKPINTGQALQIIEECKRLGLMQIADNVQRDVGFICNCCRCCCEFIQAIKRFDLKNAVISSNWLPSIDVDTCRNCGACLRACPVGALQTNAATGKPGCDSELCLGCGVCHAACKFGSLKMIRRKQRVLIPETTYDRIVAMAIERGKLTNLLFDDPSKLSHRALGRLVGVIEKSPPVKALLAIKPIKSAFLHAIVAGFKHYSES